MATSNQTALILVRQLFLDSQRYAGREDALSLMKAVLVLDLAVEQALAHVLTTFAPTAARADDRVRSKAWAAATDALRAGGKRDLLHEREVHRLHEMRNFVQHNATIPTPIEARRYQPAVEAMLAGLYLDAYGYDFANFRRWDVLQDSAFTRLMGEAEVLVEEGMPLVAIVACAAAHEGAMRSMLDPRWLPSAWEALTEGPVFSPEAFAALGTLEVRAEAAALSSGLPIGQVRQFLKCRAAVSFIESHDDPGVWVANPSSLGDHDATARFMMEYLWRWACILEDSDPTILANADVGKPLHAQPFYLERAAASKGAAGT